MWNKFRSGVKVLFVLQAVAKVRYWGKGEEPLKIRKCYMLLIVY